MVKCQYERPASASQVGYSDNPDRPAERENIQTQPLALANPNCPANSQHDRHISTTGKIIREYAFSAERMNVNSRGCQPTERAMQRLFDPEGVEQFGQSEMSEIIAQCLAHRPPIGHHSFLCKGLNPCI